jgi:hypothetical protein
VTFPAKGTKIRTLTPVYADPDGTGLYIMTSGEYEKIPTGSIGVIEGSTVGFGSTPLVHVRFPGNLLTYLGPSAWELA